MKLIKLTILAKDLGINRDTLYNWKKKGLIEFVKSPTGMNFVTEETYNKLMGLDKKKNEIN